MPDHDVRHLFDLLEGTPTPEFEASLRQRLLDLVDAPERETPTHRGSGPADEETITMVELDTSESSHGRRLLLVSAAVAAAIVVVVAMFVATGGSDEPATPAAQPTVAPTIPTTIPTTVATTIPTTATAPSTTATAPSTTVAAPRGPRITLPAELSVGTYELASAVVPLEFTTTQEWSRVLDFADRVVLGRGQESADGEFLIVFDRFDDATPETILEGLCTDQALFGEPTPTTLMGVEAFRVEATTTTACPASAIGGSGFFIGPDRTFSIVAAEIDGHVVVVFASAPVAVSTAFNPEIDALVATIRKLG